MILVSIAYFVALVFIVLGKHVKDKEEAGRALQLIAMVPIDDK